MTDLHVASTSTSTSTDTLVTSTAQLSIEDDAKQHVSRAAKKKQAKQAEEKARKERVEEENKNTVMLIHMCWRVLSLDTYCRVHAIVMTFSCSVSRVSMCMFIHM